MNFKSLKLVQTDSHPEQRGKSNIEFQVLQLKVQRLSYG